MESHSATCFFFFFAIVLAFFAIRGDGLQRRTYIVRVRAPENTSFVHSKDLTNWYRSFLPPIPANVADSRLIYTYSAAIVGFTANLTEDEVRYVEKKEDTLKVYPDRILSLLTTHTPAFLGLQAPHGFWDTNGMGKGVIIGVLDTGIKPGHPSFDGTGMPSPPPKWKGACKFEKPYCNNKLIGARKFTQGRGEDPTDFVGHGTHTAGTAAGNFVKKANVLGNGNGTAVGMAPYAHIAMYQVCQSIGCYVSDILAGINAAINDGVDVLSLSLGGESQPFSDDMIAIGAFSAMEKGVFVSCAAGNSGPTHTTLSNEAPWILTVGASSMDRKIKATVKLGNGQEVEGESAFQPADFPSKMIPLVYPIGTQLSNCNRASLFSSNVTGKVVVCDRAGGPRIEIGTAVKEAGGAALVILNKETDGCTTLAEAHYLPASDVSYINGSKILSYLNSTDKPLATISFQGTSLGTSPAPVVTFFSSRGPSLQSPGILKPDIIGPGLNVVAAWPFQIGPSETNVTSTTFNMISGTSMSTPHLSGIAALIKGAHPDWSPAAIKSAIMTTSDTTDRDGKPIKDETLQPASFFAMGAGHVNPSKAANPGLVYDLRADDYIPYLCGLGYTDQQVEAITHRKINCATIKKISEAELNYPSIAVSLELGHLTVNRTLTNVEEERSTYTVAIDVPKDISVSVSPETLEFSKLKETKSFTVSLSWNPKTTTHTEGAFRWVSTKYVVRSPIVIF
ncbi:subtilisin-like protease SBT1.2 [Ananas comosus]|uniref:Subtilisin-like protease SBT1.2 n=1 Tax=Ananas comosus TaxID=4615 RepID=A0A6P5EUH6_ANACO|nr:subtilisin-like protease SBT1.2 [Ananas comosus]